MGFTGGFGFTRNRFRVKIKKGVEEGTHVIYKHSIFMFSVLKYFLTFLLLF